MRNEPVASLFAVTCLVLFGCLLCWSSTAHAEEELDKNEDISVTITAPDANSVYPVGKNNITVSGTAHDSDCRNDGSGWETFWDSLTLTWSGSGSFDPESASPDPGEGGASGISSSWDAPSDQTGTVTITLTANDNGSAGKDNDDTQKQAQRNVILVKISTLTGTFANKSGGPIECSIGDLLQAVANIYVPQAAQATFTATSNPAGTWPSGYPDWGYSLTGWTSSVTDGQATATVTPTGEGSTGSIMAACGFSASGSPYRCVFNIMTVTVSDVEASRDGAVASAGGAALKLARAKNAAIEATIGPAEAPAYSKACFRWKVTNKPEGTPTYTLGSTTANPTTFSAQTDGTYEITGYLDVDNDGNVDAAESSKAVTVEVSEGVIFFVDDNVDVFDKQPDDTTDFNVKIEYPSLANQAVTVTVTRANGDATQHTKLNAASENTDSETVTLDGAGKGTVAFQLAEKKSGTPDTIGPGTDTLTAELNDHANVTDERPGRACGITGTTVTYRPGGVNQVNIDFVVDIQTQGVGLEHYEKSQYWAANPQSVYSAGKFEKPTGTPLAGSPFSTLRQNAEDWGEWRAASTTVPDHQKLSPAGQLFGDTWCYGYMNCDARYFTVKYRNTSTENSIVDSFGYDWDFGWNNHNLKAGDWWTELQGDTNGTITQKHNIQNFPW